MTSTLIFSDLHLGNNIHAQRLAAFLEVCDSFDRIILNGDFLDDFWDYNATTQTAWKPLFDLLKTKEVIYLFGNHDRDTKELRDATADFIDVYADTYCQIVGDKELVIMHGHSIYPRLDRLLYAKKSTLSGRTYQQYMKKIWKIVYPIMLRIRFFIEEYPKTLARLQRPVVKPQNERMKKYAEEHLEPHQILVCGHSHFAEFTPEEQFINCGANSYGRIEYISIIDDKMKLVVKEV